MTPDNDQTISKLLEDSKDMIRRFEKLSGKDQIEEMSAEVQQGALEALDEALEPAADAFFDLFVEEDGLSVVAEFRPPAHGGKPLELETIEQGLVAKGVVHGVLWDEIRNGLQDCNLELKLRTGVVIAVGTPPVPYVPEHLRLDPRWLEAGPVVEENTDVDYKAISPFVMVEKGDLLAMRIADAFGAHGIDVRGQEIPYPTEKKPDWIAGDNVADTPIGFEAAIDGRLVLEPPTFSVNPILELDNGVDYRTGNIHFKGEVIVHGKISSGFTVEAGGGIFSKDTLDAFQIKAGSDITTEGGIIGNGIGRVEAGGTVEAKFFEHLYLLAGGDVTAETCVLNSVVKTRGKLLLGDKGILAGGQVHALHGVDLYQIGTATGPRTELFLGLDFQGMEKILWIRERSQELHAQLKKVDAAIPYGGTRVKELMMAAKKLRLEILQLTETARAQLVKLGQDESASATVRGTVFPGTHLEICHVQFLVNQKMSAVRFFLDKRKGIIGVEPLAPKTTTPSGSSHKKH